MIIRKREPAAAIKHLLVGMKIAIPVLPSMGHTYRDNAWSCVNDDYFYLLAFGNWKFQSEKEKEKSDIGSFEPSSA